MTARRRRLDTTRIKYSRHADLLNAVREIVGLGPLPDVFDLQTCMEQCPHCPKHIHGRCLRHRQMIAAAGEGVL